MHVNGFSDGTLSINNADDMGLFILMVLPKNLTMNYAANRATDNIFVGGSKIREFDNKIFLNGEYFGIANAGDSVIFKKESLLSKSSLSIKNWKAGLKQQTTRQVVGFRFVY